MIGPILKQIGIILFKNKDKVIKAGQEAAKFYGKHHVAVNRGIYITAIAVVQYNTYRAKKYENELQEQHKKYKEDASNQIKTEARSIINEIDSIIEKEDLTEEEKRELKDILQRHAGWVNN